MSRGSLPFSLCRRDGSADNSSKFKEISFLDFSREKNVIFLTQGEIEVNKILGISERAQKSLITQINKLDYTD